MVELGAAASENPLATRTRLLSDWWRSARDDLPGNVMIALTMNTALAAAVGVVELTSAANKLNLVEAQPILIFTAAGLLYMVLALAIGLGAGRLERKVAILR